MLKLLSCLIPNKILRRKFRIFLPALIIKLRARSVGKNFYCSGKNRVNKNTIIKDNVLFNSVLIRGNGKVTIGNNVSIGLDTMIISDNHNYEGSLLPYDRVYISKETEIGDNVWIGARVIILPGAKIEEGAVIQAGSVVHGDIPPLGVAGGNPAQVFKYRDKGHYEKLKQDNAFNTWYE